MDSSVVKNKRRSYSNGSLPMETLQGLSSGKDDNGSSLHGSQSLNTIDDVVRSMMDNNQHHSAQLSELQQFESHVQLLTTSQLRPWVKRYLVLRNNSLMVFKSTKDERTMIQIYCGSIFQIQKLHKWNKRREFSFQVQSFGRTVVYSVDSEPLLDRWLSSIGASIKSCAILGLETSMSHILSALNNDQAKFCEEVLSCMRRTVHPWKNVHTFTTDVRRTLQSCARKGWGKSQDDNVEKLDIEDRTEPWQIPYENLILGKKIAEGFYGEVFKGALWGKQVAIKRLKFSAEVIHNDPEKEKIVRKLKEEASIMSTLRHPNVLLFMGLSTDLPNICLVTEFMEKGSLHDVVQGTMVNDGDFIRMISDICCGMNYLHKRSILHLDLKALNLLVDDNGSVKVADFGISRITQGLEKKIKGPQGYGTVLYMPPEVVMGGMSDENTTYYDYTYDVFSFGVMLFELMYTREHPDVNFVVDDNIGYELLREPLMTKGEASLPPWWPEVIVDIISKCTSNDPKSRPPFEDIIQLLKNSDLGEKYGDWFILRHNARRIKELADDSENYATLEYHKARDTLFYFIDYYKDGVILLHSLCALIVLSSKRDNQDHIVHRVVNQISEVMKDHHQKYLLIQAIVQMGEFRYFEILLESSTFYDRNIILLLLLEIANDDRAVNRFIREGMVRCLHRISYHIQSFQPNPDANVNICSLLKRCASALDTELLDRFMADEGAELLIYFIQHGSRESVFLSLQTLTDIAVRFPEFAKVIEEKGINPIQMASRAYLGALVNQQRENERVSSPTNSTALAHQTLRRRSVHFHNIAQSMDEKKPVNYRFNKARDRLLSMFDNTPHLENQTLISQPEETEIVVRLWELIKEQKDLSMIDTASIKETLKSECTLRMNEKQNLSFMQIDKVVGQMEPPSEIVNRLYLGSEWNSSNIQELQNLKITHIINLSPESPNYYQSKFTYKTVSISPPDTFPLVAIFDELFQYMENVLSDERHSILVHSHFGVGRSAAFMVAYLMKKKQWKLSKSYKYVKDKRPIVQVNRRIMRSLMDMELSLGFESSLGQNPENKARSLSSSPYSLVSVTEMLKPGIFDQKKK